MNYIKLFVANRKGLGWSVGFWERERAMELNIKTAACLCCVCPLTLSRLLLSSVLDYGSPLVYVITKTFNWVWQLRPALDMLNIFEYVSLTSAKVVELVFVISTVSCTHFWYYVFFVFTKKVADKSDSVRYSGKRKDDLVHLSWGFYIH